MFWINLDHNTFLWTYVQALLCSFEMKHVLQYVATLACPWTDFQFVLKSPILLLKYFFNWACANLALFVVLLPIWRFLSTQNLTNFSLTGSKIYLFNIIKKLRKFCAYNFELDPIINRCFLRFGVHNIQSCSHHSLHHQNRLDRFPILAFEILHFAIQFTLCSHILSNVIWAQQSSSFRENLFHSIDQSIVLISDNYLG